jgi:hypothetical protein
MKKIMTTLTLLLTGLSVLAQHDHATPSADSLKKSVYKEVHEQIGKAHIMLGYSAPAVRGRVIWGGLIPYDEVWVTGAHQATWFDTSEPIELNGVKIPAGKYGLFTIPGKDKWIVIINKNWEQHLADEYDQKDDIARIEVTPTVSERIQERLKYTIEPLSERKFRLTIRWEKIAIAVDGLVTK